MNIHVVLMFVWLVSSFHNEYSRCVDVWQHKGDDEKRRTKTNDDTVGVPSFIHFSDDACLVFLHFFQVPLSRHYQGL